MSRMLSMLDPFEEIKRIYFSTTRETIERDMARALELLKHMPDDDARQRAAGYMHGMSDLKREWAPRRKHARKPKMKGSQEPARGQGARAQPKKKSR